MKHLDYRMIKILLICWVFSLFLGLYSLIMMVTSYAPFQLRVTLLIISCSPFICFSILHYFVNKKIDKYEEWLSVVVKENYVDSVCAKYKIKKNDVMPLHYATQYLLYESFQWAQWLKEIVSIFVFTDNQLYVYQEAFNPAYGTVVSKTSNYYYYNDITNFELEESNGAIGVKFTAGNTTFDEHFRCEEGDGTYDSIMFLQDSIRKHHENK